MREASEEDLEASLAVEVPRKALVPEVHPGLDRVPDHHLGESKAFSASQIVCIIS